MPMKYKGKYITIFPVFLRKPMNEAYGKKTTRKALCGAKKIYRDMLSRTEDIGEDNPMASNIYMAYVFLAIWKAADGKITLPDFKEVTKKFMHRPIIQKIMSGRDINKKEDLEKLTDRFHTMKQWAQEHPQYLEKTWDFNFDETKHQDGVYYHFTHCPIEKFARENGFLEILPVACDLDYLTAESMHGILHREYTLATGGPVCDYWFVPDKITDPE